MTRTTVVIAPGPQACGTCRNAGQVDPDPIHQACAQRAALIEAPDMPSWEDLTDMTMEEKAALPARFHIPRFVDVFSPPMWVCAACWGDAIVTPWPCATATKHGGEIFTPEHLVRRR